MGLAARASTRYLVAYNSTQARGFDSCDRVRDLIDKKYYAREWMTLFPLQIRSVVL